MLFFAAVIAVVLSVALATNPLGPYSVSDVTVSGLSSGAFMAVQMHVAYSSIVNGSAIFAGVSLFILIFNYVYRLIFLLYFFVSLISSSGFIGSILLRAW